MFLIFQVRTRDPGNEVDHVLNVQPVDDINVQRFIPREDGAKRTLNLMNLLCTFITYMANSPGMERFFRALKIAC